MFRFRLQKVLELREQNEQDAAARLSAARGEAERARDAAAALQAVRRAGAEKMQSAHGAQASAGLLQHLNFVLQQLDQHIVAADNVCGAAEAKERKSLADYTLAYRDRRVLDTLRERHKDAWRAGEVQADRKEMDSVALSQRTLRMGGAR